MSRKFVRNHKLSGLIDTDSDDGRNAMPTPDSAAENMPPPSRPRGRPKAASGKISKPITVQRRLSGKAPKGKRGRRPVLTDRRNQQNGNDTEEVDEFEDQGDHGMEGDASHDELEEAFRENVRKAPVGKTRGRKAKTRPRKIPVAPEIPATQLPVINATKKAPQNKKKPTAKFSAEVEETIEETQKMIQETQPSPMDLDVSENEIIPEPTPVAPRARPRPPVNSRQASLTRRRPGSASDTERSDPVVRRKLGDMTKKFENLDLKYRNLRDLGIKEAENNFERLSKQCEEKTRVSNELIASLKSDLAKQSALAKETRSLRKQVESRDSEIEKLKAKLAQMSTSLAEAQSENKILSTKLAANRNAAASVESVHAKVPGSAVKANGIRMIGSAEAALAAQTAQLKEDLYSDLCGLIIRGVKRDADQDVYDCIQTGRNGTLHFKLAMANEKTLERDEEAQCTYIPQLDPDRDQDLKRILENCNGYLVDEISFAGYEVGKFYARVMRALTEDNR